jgi:peptidyl-prolyl cis-trans isomerase SurA
MLARIAAVVVAFGLSLSVAGSGRAQEVDRIAAVVNDEIVSVQDVEARVKLAIVMSNLPDNIEVRRRVVPQVLRKMIDERLQMQEANRVKISLTPEEVQASIVSIEQQNRMPPGGLLKELERLGADPQAARDQIKADLIWMKTTGRVLQPTVRIGEEEIDERLEVVKQRQGRPEYLVSEIFLAVDNLRQEEEARRLGERLLDQLKAGAPFPALARQFSQSASAANNGSMGWVADGVLDEEINSVLARLEKGQVSTMIRAVDGFHIVAMVDRRIAGQASTEAHMTVAQTLFPVPPKDAPPRQVLMAKAAEISASTKDCKEFEEMGRRIHADKTGRAENVRLSEVPQPLRQALVDLPVNKASVPIDVNNGFLVLMICSRETPPAQANALPTREAIRRSIEDEKLEMLTRRYLRDLRRTAFIDVRM